jgi:cysteinyl-tRNA synthetase
MSKSLKNFVTVRELLRTQCDALTFRLFVLLHKYHSNVDYSEGAAALTQCERLPNAETATALHSSDRFGGPAQSVRRAYVGSGGL